MTINHAPLGDTMVVHGDSRVLARLELGDTIIWGPLVTINQATNRADVDGAGAMQMPSNKNLDGTDRAPDKADKSKSERVTIHWTKHMTFDGKDAHFIGGVQAIQNDAKSNEPNSRLLCEKMIATLDRSVSFKDGQKKDQNAKIDRIVCDQRIVIYDKKVDEHQRTVQLNILNGSALTNYQEGATFLTGPGSARTLGLSGSDVALAPAAPAPRPAPKMTSSNGSRPASISATAWRPTPRPTPRTPNSTAPTTASRSTISRPPTSKPP